MENEKIKSGIQGFDTVLKGGLRKGVATLVTGSPGTGKTIFGIQFIVGGAKNNEPGLYIVSEESEEDLRNYSRSLGLELEKYEKNGLITILRQPLAPKKLMSIAAPLSIIKSKKIQRVVLDSLTMFKYAYFPEEVSFRREVLSYISNMKKAGVTSLTISEKSLPHFDDIKYIDEDFVFDGVILLTKIRKSSSYEHCITVQKMRGQDHLVDVFPYKIQKGGVIVYPDQLPFSLIEKDSAQFTK
ncbi:MAG: ATPase domain-containing protein [Candidatus Woesearchaeota archaeon]